jgi:hypothetical protein
VRGSFAKSAAVAALPAPEFPDYHTPIVVSSSIPSFGTPEWEAFIEKDPNNFQVWLEVRSGGRAGPARARPLLPTPPPPLTTPPPPPPLLPLLRLLRSPRLWNRPALLMFLVCIDDKSVKRPTFSTVLRAAPFFYFFFLSLAAGATGGASRGVLGRACCLGGLTRQ